MFGFYFNNTGPTELYTLSLHDALPICYSNWAAYQLEDQTAHDIGTVNKLLGDLAPPGVARSDRKSTRLNSSHSQISYAVFCLKKKNLSRPSCCAALSFHLFQPLHALGS